MTALRLRPWFVLAVVPLVLAALACGLSPGDAAVDGAAAAIEATLAETGMYFLDSLETSEGRATVHVFRLGGGPPTGLSATWVDVFGAALERAPHAYEVVIELSSLSEPYAAMTAQPGAIADVRAGRMDSVTFFRGVQFDDGRPLEGGLRSALAAEDWVVTGVEITPQRVDVEAFWPEGESREEVVVKWFQALQRAGRHAPETEEIYLHLTGTPDLTLGASQGQLQAFARGDIDAGTFLATLTMDGDVDATAAVIPTPPPASPTATAPAAEVGEAPLEGPIDVVEAFMRATLGSLPDGDLDYERARGLMTADYAAVLDGPEFVPLIYGIQEGPGSYEIDGEITGDLDAMVFVLGYWGADLGREWTFFLIYEDGVWRIEGVEGFDAGDFGDPIHEFEPLLPFWELNPMVDEFSVRQDGGWVLVIAFDPPAQETPVHFLIEYYRADDGTLAYVQQDTGLIPPGWDQLTLESDWSGQDLAELGFWPGAHWVVVYIDYVEVGLSELIVD